MKEMVKSVWKKCSNLKIYSMQIESTLKIKQMQYAIIQNRVQAKEKALNTLRYNTAGHAANLSSQVDLFQTEKASLLKTCSDILTKHQTYTKSMEEVSQLMDHMVKQNPIVDSARYRKKIAECGAVDPVILSWMNEDVVGNITQITLNPQILQSLHVMKKGWFSSDYTRKLYGQVE